jgi:fucose 4-O-acetylase-like acetyltransferase
MTVKGASMRRARESWIDNIKVFACILVTLGHFMQSMTNSQLITACWLTRWFNDTIYLFHVPLFFVCSGFVYQKYSRIDSFAGWGGNILKKLITLGIPYLTFSLITWLLKTVFSGSVNMENQDLLTTLLVEPVAPYWFLYGLFLMFLLIPTFRRPMTMAVVMAVTLTWKLVFCFVGELPVYMLSRLMENAVWFAGGMVLAQTKVMEKCRQTKWMLIGVGLGTVFLVLTLFFHDLRTTQPILGFVMGLIACAAVIFVMNYAFCGEREYPVWAYMARYTMPVFLMHTIFAAGWRAVLMKVGLTNGAVHIITGLVITFVGPVVAAWIMSKFKFLDFFINPGRYIRIGKKDTAVK